MHLDVAVAYGVAGLSTVALIVLWFANAYRVLCRKRDAVYEARKELRLHRNGYREKLGSPEETTARHMLDTSTQIYEQIRLAYNRVFHKPAYRIPGVLMGFKNIIE